MELDSGVEEYKSACIVLFWIKQQETLARHQFLKADGYMKARLRKEVDDTVAAANKRLPERLAITHYQVEIDPTSIATEKRPTFYAHIDGIGGKPYTHKDDSGFITPPRRILRAFRPLVRSYREQGLSLIVWMRNTRVPEQTGRYSLIG